MFCLWEMKNSLSSNIRHIYEVKYLLEVERHIEIDSERMALESNEHIYKNEYSSLRKHAYSNIQKNFTNKEHKFSDKKF